jgi:hypothetical protein
VLKDYENKMQNSDEDKQQSADNFMGSAEYAHQLGIDERTARYWLHKKGDSIGAKKIGRNWIVPRNAPDIREVK